ncbi:hypothetical protein BABINDRAFT_159527 [Babjeviella inositovora NRRL Y-12698]|uniref:Pirin N-terminal domain-containing protein n=1 Tax=Babjeviella inositovora NRRL Y-12698 TaxID=984486 RepID=A0A1E3QZQ4_9ASCO|nr:uncharacterized protein BABINDRAFT_159527 [Babjeviella inositovora NRRL Y-12698]ODQ83065.1 hypothetical protein BABINDRAFT_159527 [Babjeviella inositovora NRRL Y-12698]
MKPIPRSILKFIAAVERPEGVGAMVRRAIGVRQMRTFTPFLLFDHFKASSSAGFPDHPHRGHETVTYLLTGSLQHHDFAGGSGVLNTGDLQFMTAGRGIMHAEVPVASEDANVTGLQLWVDLPERLKEVEPRYRDLRAPEIPIVTPNAKVTVKVISGEAYGVASHKELAYTPVEYYDYEVRPGGTFEQKIPKNFNVFVYTFAGKDLLINHQHVPLYEAVFFSQDGDAIVGEVPPTSVEVSRFVIVAGEALDQPIIQDASGVFVETSKERLKNALKEFKTATGGFERRNLWTSKAK